MIEPDSEYWTVTIDGTNFKFTNRQAAHDFRDEKQAQGKECFVLHTFTTAHAWRYPDWGN